MADRLRDQIEQALEDICYQRWAVDDDLKGAVMAALDPLLSAVETERVRLVAALDAAMCPTCDQTIRHGHAPDCPSSLTPPPAEGPETR